MSAPRPRSSRGPSPSPRTRSASPAPNGGKPNPSPRKPSPSPRTMTPPSAGGNGGRASPSPRASGPAPANKTPRTGRSASPATRPPSRQASSRGARSTGPPEKEALEDRLGKQQTIVTNRVRSIIRLRPRSVKGESDAELHAVEYDISSRLLWVLPGEGAPVPDRRQFDADGMIGPDAGADAAFGEVRDCVESVLAGTPGCVVAYGAHGTGKTRTLFAPDGLAALAARVLFAKGEPTRISVQFIEIYFELLADLLDASSRVTLREGGNKTQLYGTASTECASADDVENAIATGQAARRADCARSSAVLVLHVSSATTADSVPLYFVDLSSTDGLKLGGGADGVALAPPTSAYASLHTFERTLHVLSDRKVKIKPPIRESRLTRVLANVFSAGGKMCVLVHIALGAGELALTLASLDFAQLAMRVSLKEAKNEKGLDNDTVTKNLQSQIDAFDESSAKRHGEVEAQIRAEMARAAGGAKNAAELRTAVAAAHKVYASLLDKVGKGRGAEKANGQPAPDPEEVRLAEETHKTIMEMRAQIDAARKLRDEVTVMLPEIAAEYRELGGHAWHSGDTAKTRMYYDKALVAYTKCMGKDHPEVACSMGDLANVYCDEGRFDEAIELYQKAYKVHNDAYGPDHVDTAGDLASLGLVYSVQGKHKQALPLLKEAYAIMEKHLEDDHPNLVQVKTFMENSLGAI